MRTERKLKGRGHHGRPVVRATWHCDTLECPRAIDVSVVPGLERSHWLTIGAPGPVLHFCPECALVLMDLLRERGFVARGNVAADAMCGRIAGYLAGRSTTTGGT